MGSGSSTPTVAQWPRASADDVRPGRGQGERQACVRREGASEAAAAAGGGYCRLLPPFKRAFAVRETVAGHTLGAMEGGGLGITHPPTHTDTHTSAVPGAVNGGGEGM